VRALGPGGHTVIRFAYTEGTVTSWYDWRMALAWFMVVAIATGVYLLPITRMVENLSN
jgi:hypothetical protein